MGGRATIGASVLVGLAVVAAAHAIPHATQRPGGAGGRVTLSEARTFRGFPLYFPGRHVLGLPLNAIVRERRTTPARYTEFVFIYGRCPAASSSCVTPLHVLVWPACNRYRTRYDIPRRERITVRGTAARFSTRTIPRIEVYARAATVVVNGWGIKRKASLLHVVARLRGLNNGVGVGERLPRRPPATAGVRCR